MGPSKPAADAEAQARTSTTPTGPGAPASTADPNSTVEPTEPADTEARARVSASAAGPTESVGSAGAATSAGSARPAGPTRTSRSGKADPRSVTRSADRPEPAASPPREGRLKPSPAPAPAEATAPWPTPEEAFDALYDHAAPGLVHQTYLLTGRRRLSRESVEYAFHHAWQHWPEVARDGDPVGWVRATAYEYALSPWHRFRRRHRHPDAPPTEAARRALLGVLLDLPAPYRRTVLLYDGLGLDLPETAAETEASTPAAGNRLLHARTVIGQKIPDLAEPEALQRRLAALVAEAPTATLPAAHAVRTRSERRLRLLTRAVAGVSAALIGVTAFTAATAPTRYIPVNAPGAAVEGVPVRGGPQKLRPEDKELRERLRTAPNPGPERLVPAAR
ncbi:DNA-directed RNA polymerase sigma-70 factor [Streptomyces sp. NPDC048623]|uniref:DNA-directed RNA polymerase sigma-70 factor n=1 Tax=Streptomyces sp. NPDC048623 TaxID=3155761 RepID=UPI00342AA9DB